MGRPFGAFKNKVKEVGLTTKLCKCQLAMTECTYLGNDVGGGLVKPVTRKNKAISSVSATRNKETGLIFLGAKGLLPALPARLCVTGGPSYQFTVVVKTTLT